MSQKVSRRERRKLAEMAKRMAQTAPLVLAFWMAGHGSAEAATFNVTNTNDSGAGSLRNAILLANVDENPDDDLINVIAGNIQLAGAAGEDSNNTGDLDIRRNTQMSGRLTIRGAGAANTFVRGGSDRVFDTSGSDVTIEDLTIADGVATNGVFGGAGGGVYAYGGALALNRVTFQNNRAQGGNGASGPIGTNGDSGGSAVGGALTAIFLNSLSIDNCRFVNNSALGGNGGAGGSGFSSESASTSPGNGGSGGSALGGGALVYFTDVMINRTTFDGNTAAGGVGGAGGFGTSSLSGGSGGAGGDASGGGLLVVSANIHTAQIDNSTLSRNSSQGGIGGVGGDAFSRPGNGGRGGEGQGGGLSLLSVGTGIQNATISSNTAAGGDGGGGGVTDGQSIGNGGLAGDGLGGGIYAYGCSVDVTSATIAANSTAAGVDGGGGSPSTTREAGYEATTGGGIFSDGSAFTLVSTLMADNTAEESPDFYGVDETSDGQPVNTVDFSLLEDTDGTTVFGNNNILDQESDLGPLGDNGGPTETHFLPGASIAVDAGDNPSNAPLDQRGTGFPREVGGAPDIGAIEAPGLPAPSVPDLLAASDSGASETDNNTNVVLPTFTGTADAAYTQVQILADGNIVGSALTNAGAYSVTLTTPLNQGTRQITARGLAGKAVGTESAALAVTIDTIAPSGSIIVNNVNDASPPMLYTFTVAYFDRVDTTSLDSSDITIAGPNGFNISATFASFTTVNNLTTATYTFVPPGGIWDTTDNGAYNLAGLDGEVLDLAGNAGRAATASFDVAVTRVVTVPTDIALSTSVIAENRPAGTVIGTFTTADTAGDTHTYTLVGLDGNNFDNAAFAILGNQLTAVAPFDFEAKSSYTIRVRTTDQTSQFYEENFTITVTDLVENLPPIIDSIAFTPHDPVAGKVTTFVVAARDPEGQPLTFSFAYGDGSTGTTTSHIYAAAGTYTVTVTASDGSLTASKTLTIVVKPNDDDDDDDGFPDIIEEGLGSGSDDSTSIPTTGTSNLDLNAVSLALDFRKPKRDVIQIVGTLPIPANFKPQGARVAVNVGGVVKVFSVDGQVLTPTPFANDAFKLRINKARGVATFTLTMKKGEFQALLTDEGLTNTTVTGEQRSLKVQVIFGNILYETTVTLKYTARQGKTGKASGK